MDSAVFDRIARRFASRRSALRAAALAGAAGAAGLASATGDGIAAAPSADRRPACRKPGASCSRTRKCCESARCSGGVCKCRAGLTACGGRCVDLDKDARNCGKCNNRCPQAQTCNAGVCCEPGRTICEGTCCGAGETCVPAYDIFKALCCAPDLVYVLCPNERIVFDQPTESSYCDLPAADLAGLEQACCPASAVCPTDGLCCIDPGTREPLACSEAGTCLLFGVSPASYTPPVKGRN
ncbi:MAG: hypothetical protein ACKOWF_09640 [Chloroflexota bacterium]